MTEYWFTLYFSDSSGHISKKKLNEMISKQFGLEYDKSNANLEKLDIEIAEECAKRGYEYHKLNSGKNYLDWQLCTSVLMLIKRLRKWSDAK